MSDCHDDRKMSGGSDLEEECDCADCEECHQAKIFPQRLMELLADENNADCIAWLDHGKAFIIRNRKLFAEKVMPKCFPRKSKYSSFTRKLNRWNFTRISSGPEHGAFYHDFFLRDKPHLAAQMFCKNARSKLAMATGGESLAVANAKRETAVEELDMEPRPTPSFNLPPQYAAAALAAKSALPSSCDERLKAQLLEQQNLLEVQMRIVQQADPASRLILHQAVLKEQSAHMQKLGICWPQHPFPQQSSAQMAQNLATTTLALQQSQARLMQMREILTMRYRSRAGKPQSPTNNRASAA